MLYKENSSDGWNRGPFVELLLWLSQGLTARRYSQDEIGTRKDRHSPERGPFAFC